MATFFIIPPRKISGSVSGFGFVESLNNLQGDVTLAATDGIQITASGNTLTITPVPDYFVKKHGDDFLGNLDFTPESGGYGLKLLSSTVDPAQSSTGAIYYNTTDSVLKLYNGAAWVSVLPGGTVTTGNGDLRWLKLDGSNSPMTGDLLMGTSTLRLGSLATDPGSGTPGDVYFNSTSQSSRLYTESGWVGLGSGVTEIIAGDGLTGGTITTEGTIALNLAYSPTWTGSHTFTHSITFSNDQLFPIDKLYISGEAKGDLTFYDGTAWSRLPIGTVGQTLVVNSSGEAEWDDDTSGTIGTPEDPEGYGDGYFSTWIPSTRVADAFDDVNVLLAALAPAQANVLTGQTLTLSSPPTFYSAIIAAGNTSAWYPAGFAAGSTINNLYYLSGTLTMVSPNPGTTFRCGKANQTATYGTISHLLTAADGTTSTHESYAMSAGAGTTGDLTVSSISTYNSLWAKANAQIAYVQSADGYLGHSMSHTLAGTTNVDGFWRDTWTNSNPNPSFSTAPAVTVATLVQKWQSGVLYLGLNTVLDLTFAGASGIFRYCYNPTRVAEAACTGLSPNLQMNPVSVPNYADIFDKTGANFVALTLNAANQSSLSTTMSVTLYKAGAGSTTATAALPHRVCTYGTVSTQTAEYFQDEAQRTLNNSTSAFDPTVTPVATGYAQVRLGTLTYPVSADYAGSPAFTGAREWQRYFYKTSASTGTLTLGTLTFSQIDPYGTGELNMLLQLEGDGQYYDLGRSVGDNNGTGDGTSRANSKGGRISGNGGAVAWSVGTNTTGVSGSGNTGRFRLIIIFAVNTTTRQITSIVSS